MYKYDKLFRSHRSLMETLKIASDNFTISTLTKTHLDSECFDIFFSMEGHSGSEDASNAAEEYWSELSESLKELKYRLKQYRNYIKEMSENMTEKILENIKIIKELSKTVDIEKCDTFTRLPNLDHFSMIDSNVLKIIQTLLDHDTSTFLEHASNPEEVNLFDSVFDYETIEAFSELKIIRNGNLLQFNAVEAQQIVLNDSAEAWIKDLKRIERLAEYSTVKEIVTYINKLMSEISHIAKTHQTTEYLFPSLNVLISTIQQLVLVELYEKNRLMQFTSDIRTSMNDYLKMLDRSDVLLFD